MNAFVNVCVCECVNAFLSFSAVVLSDALLNKLTETLLTQARVFCVMRDWVPLIRCFSRRRLRAAPRAVGAT